VVRTHVLMTNRLMLTISNYFDALFCSRNEPYSSSKYASDLVSVAINDQFNNKVCLYT